MWFSTELPPVNPDLTTDITILKEVEGPMGDFQKEFCFTYSYVSGNGEIITGDFVLKDHDADGEKRKKKMDRGMNLRPVTMDFLFQAGVGCIGFYAKYSPFGLFEKDKGPKVHSVSLGLQLHI